MTEAPIWNGVVLFDTTTLTHLGAGWAFQPDGGTARLAWLSLYDTAHITALGPDLSFRVELPGKEVLLGEWLKQFPSNTRINAVGRTPCSAIPEELVARCTWVDLCNIADAWDLIIELAEEQGWDPCEHPIDALVNIDERFTIYEDAEEYIRSSGAFEIPEFILDAVDWTALSASDLRTEWDDLVITQRGRIYAD